MRTALGFLIAALTATGCAGSNSSYRAPAPAYAPAPAPAARVTPPPPMPRGPSPAERAAALNHEGEALARKPGTISRSVALFADATKLDPSLSRYWFNLCFVQHKLGRFVAAKRACNQVFRARGDAALRPRAKAIIADIDQRAHRATPPRVGPKRRAQPPRVSPRERAAKLNAKGKDFWLMRKDLNRAAKHFADATKLDPHEGRYWFNLCAVQRQMGRLVNAERSCRQVLKTNSGAAVHRRAKVILDELGARPGSPRRPRGR